MLDSANHRREYFAGVLAPAGAERCRAALAGMGGGRESREVVEAAGD